MAIHGPTIAETWDHMTGWLIATWAVAFFFWLFSMVTWYRHRNELMTCQRSMLRELYIRISTLSVVFSTTSLLTLVFPRPAYLWHFLRVIYEVFTLKCFEYNITELLGVVGAPGRGYGSAEEERQNALKVLLEAQPQKYYGAPPLGCCFLPCLKRMNFSSRLYTNSKRLVSQYLYFRPLAGLTILWLILDNSLGDTEQYTGYPEGTILGGLETLSMLVAMEGLFILYWGSRSALAQYRVGLKFIAIKFVIFVGAIQNFMLETNVPKEEEGDFYDQEARVELWNNALLLVESAGLTLLMWRAFPAEELVRAHVFRMSGKSVEDLDDPSEFDFPRSTSYGASGLPTNDFGVNHKAKANKYNSLDNNSISLESPSRNKRKMSLEYDA